VNNGPNSYAAAAALFRAQYSRVFPLPSGLIFAAYPPMGYTTVLS
jgi:hypothetical protein